MPDRCTHPGSAGRNLLQRNMPCAPELFLKAVAPTEKTFAGTGSRHKKAQLLHYDAESEALAKFAAILSRHCSLAILDISIIWPTV
jgi:hypothetical protein